MQFHIQVNRGEDGTYEAQCPEMGLSVRGLTVDQVLDKMRGLVVFCLNGAEEVALPNSDDQDVARRISRYLENKNLHLPRNPKVH